MDEMHDVIDSADLDSVRFEDHELQVLQYVDIFD